MELKIKVKTNNPSEIRDIVKLIKDIEREYSCKCTLLEIEID